MIWTIAVAVSSFIRNAVATFDLVLNGAFKMFSTILSAYFASIFLGFVVKFKFACLSTSAIALRIFELYNTF